MDKRASPAAEISLQRGEIEISLQRRDLAYWDENLICCAEPRALGQIQFDNNSILSK